MPDSREESIRTICGFCHTNCGLIVSVRDGIITAIKADPEHPVNRGDACPKGMAGKQVVYSPERLKYPMRRTKSGFERISWDTALDFIAERLLEIKDKYGGQAIFRGGGAPVTDENRDGFAQLIQSLGSINYTGAGHICHMPREIGFQSVFGHMSQPDYVKTRCIVIWGANPPVSRRYSEAGAGFSCAYGGFNRLISSAKKRGVKLIVIDPCQNSLTGIADKWLRIEPARDDALALAMLNVIILEKLYDADFVSNWTVGFDRLASHVEKYTPEWAEKITGLSAGDIREVARIYATGGPAIIKEGNALDQSSNAVQTVRAVAMLIAITGNLDREGGNVFFPFPRLSPLTAKSDLKRLSADSYPLFPNVPFPFFVDAIFSGKPYPPRALIINHANPMLVDANSTRTREALEKLDLLVVCDIFKTATTELAHIILPAASIFECYGSRGYVSAEGGFLALRRKAVEPVGESLPVFEIEYRLAEKMELQNDYTWKNNEEWITHRLKASQVTLQDLLDKQIIYTTPPLEYSKYQHEGFNTPSGKVELYSQKFQDLGYSPLPDFIEKDGSIKESPELLNKFPLIGTSRRPSSFTHSQFRNIPELRKLDPENLLRINPKDATARSITDGCLTTIESAQGKIQTKARITEEIAPGVVLIDFGWGNPGDGGANVNILTGDTERDPISCSTPNQRFRCQATKG